VVPGGGLRCGHGPCSRTVAVIIYGPLVNPALRHREVWLRDPDH
jgi:hypothetical protein